MPHQESFPPAFFQKQLLSKAKGNA